MKIKRTLNDMFELMDKAIKGKDSNLEVEIELTDEELHDIEEEQYEYDKEKFIEELFEVYNEKNNLYRILSTKELKRMVDKVFMYDSGSMMLRGWKDIVKNTINGKFEELITKTIIEETPWTYDVSFNVVVPCSVVVNAYSKEQAENYVRNFSDEEIRKAIASYKGDAKAENVKSVETTDYWGADIDIDLGNKRG